MKQAWMLLAMSGMFYMAAAQKNNSADSAAVVQTLHTLATICKSLYVANPEVKRQGNFYKAASYVVYRGQDSKRKWKTFCNYKNMEDKGGVDNMCERINQTINQDSAWQILRYSTETESESKWHVLEVLYTSKGRARKAVFAFLKIGQRFGLGDID